MEFSGQEYCSGLPFPSPGDRLDLGIKHGSSAFQADTLPSELPGKLLSCHTHNTMHSVQFSHSVVSNSLRPHKLKEARSPCPSPTPGACSDSCPSRCDAIQPSYPLSFHSPPAFNLSQHQGLFQ